MSNIDYTALINDDIVEETPAVMSMRAASNDSENWRSMSQHSLYKSGDAKLYDTDFSEIDKKRKIDLDKNQINLSADQFSQFIPFIMDRYQDGIDLANATILINYVRPTETVPNTVVASNAEYSDTKVRFGWLVDNYATEIAGTLKFEIEAIGTLTATVKTRNPETGVITTSNKQQAYTWRSQPNDGLRVLQGLGSGNAVTLPDNWQTMVAASVAQGIASQLTEDEYYKKSTIDNKIGLIPADKDIKTYVDEEVGKIEAPDLSPLVRKDKVNLELNNDSKILTLTYDDNKTKTVDFTTILNSIDLSDELGGLKTELEDSIAAEVEAIDSQIATINSSFGDLGKHTNEEGVEVNNTVVDYVGEQLGGYYTKTEIDNSNDSIKASFGELGKHTDENGDEVNNTVVDYVGEKLGDLEGKSVHQYIDDLNIDDKLTNYYTKEDVEGRLNINTMDEGGEVIQHTVASFVSEKLEDLINVHLGDFKDPNTNEIVPIKKYIDDKDFDDKLTEYAKKGYDDDLTVEEYLTGKLGTGYKDPITGQEMSVKDYIESQLEGSNNSNYYTLTYGERDLKGDGTKVKDVLTLWESQQSLKDLKTPEDLLAIATPIINWQISGGTGTGSLNVLTLSSEKDSGNAFIKSYTFRPEDVEEKRALLKYSFRATTPTGSPISFAYSKLEQRESNYVDGWESWNTLYMDKEIENTEGELASLDVSQWLTKNGTYQFRFTAYDETGGNASLLWTVIRTNFSVSLNFNDKIARPISSFEVPCSISQGGLNSTVYFYLDNYSEPACIWQPAYATDKTTVTVPIDRIPEQLRHGAHLLTVYMVATSGGRTITSNYEYRDVMLFDPNIESREPIVGCAPPKLKMAQYGSITLKYCAFDPDNSNPVVEISEYKKGESPIVVKEETLKNNLGEHTFQRDEAGTYYIHLQTKSDTARYLGERTVEIEVEPLKLEATPVPGAVIDFSAAKNMNIVPTPIMDADENIIGWEVWNNGTYSFTASSDFDWSNGGFRRELDEDGKVVLGTEHLLIKAGTYIDLDYKFFTGEIKRVDGVDIVTDYSKKDGRDFKLIFKTLNVKKDDAKFLECIETDNEGKKAGLEMFVHEAYIHGKTESLNLPYSEEDRIEFGFQITKDRFNDNNELTFNSYVLGYEDGVPTSAMVCDEGQVFMQNSPKIIRLGSDDCDLLIYKLRIYEKELTTTEELNNFVLDAPTGEEIVDRDNRNKIYKIEGNEKKLDPQYLSTLYPDLRVIVISAPTFTEGKDYPVTRTTVEYYYGNGEKEGVPSYWKCEKAMHKGQGTSSDSYGAAGRNIDLVLREDKKNVDEYKNKIIPVLTVGKGAAARQVDKVALSGNSVPNDYFTIKLNIASSENANNALLAKRYDDFKYFQRPIIRKDEEEKEKVRDTMLFHNCVVFIQETGASGHQEFEDNDIHFYGIGNIGDSKNTDSTRLNKIDDELECCLEIVDVDKPLSEFPVNTIINAMSMEKNKETNQMEYVWLKDENRPYLLKLVDGEYVHLEAGDPTIPVDEIYYIDALEADGFNKTHTYDWRYINDEKGDEGKAAWIELYKFITKDLTIGGKLDKNLLEEWKEEFSERFVLDSVLYYYLFTERYLLVDNRAKNSFWHYSKVYYTPKQAEDLRKEGYIIDNSFIDEELASEEKHNGYRWDLTWGYDMDTALGTDNDGDIVYEYGLEDIDYVDGVEVFRESQSTFFRRVREYFSSELEIAYNKIEEQNKSAWSADDLINTFDKWQSEFPEELWRLDIERKYIRTYTKSFINSAGQSRFLDNMANGKKKYQRRQFERNQAKYISSKYLGSDAKTNDNTVQMRTWDVSQAEKEGILGKARDYTVTLKPFKKTYLSVNYGGNTDNKRAVDLDATYTFEFKDIDLDTGALRRPDFIDVYNAESIASLGDLSALYLSELHTGTAKKLKQLLVGAVSEGKMPYFNDQLKTFTFSGNKMLEDLNIQNIGSIGGIDAVKNIKSLKNIWATGTNIEEFTGADYGDLEELELPAVKSIVLRNCLNLKTVSLDGYNKLTQLVMINCPEAPSLEIIKLIDLTKATNINLTNINWNLEDDLELLKSLYDNRLRNDGEERIHLDGVININMISKRDKELYEGCWPIKIISADIRESYLITFKNPNGEVLSEQWVIDGFKAVEPEIPTYEDGPEYDYTFRYWSIEGQTNKFHFDSTIIVDNMVMVAQYDQKKSEYTIGYYDENGNVLQEDRTVPYGSYVPYSGEKITTRIEGTNENPIYKIFKGWNHSGFADANKIITPVFETFEYKNSYFNVGASEYKPLNTLNAAGLMAITQFPPERLVNLYSDLAEEDTVIIQMGETYDTYEDNNHVFKNEMRAYEGGPDGEIVSNHNLTKNEDFVFVIDYKMDKNSNSGVLVESRMSDYGFRLYKEGGVPYFSWNGQPIKLPNNDYKQTLVIKHEKDYGDISKIKYFLLDTSSNLTENLQMAEYKSDITNYSNDAVLVFGGGLDSTGTKTQNGIRGQVYWAKKFYGLLSDDECKKLVIWPRENIEMIPCFISTENKDGPKTFDLSSGTGLNTLTLLSKYLLPVPKPVATSWQNTYWENYQSRSYLNGHFFEGISTPWHEVLKKVQVQSCIGNNTTNKKITNDYVFIPSAGDFYTKEENPYNNEGTKFIQFSGYEKQRCYIQGENEPRDYQTRSSDGTNYYYIGSDGVPTSKSSWDGSNTLYIRFLLCI